MIFARKNFLEFIERQMPLPPVPYAYGRVEQAGFN